MANRPTRAQKLFLIFEEIKEMYSDTLSSHEAWKTALLIWKSFKGKKRDRLLEEINRGEVQRTNHFSQPVDKALENPFQILENEKDNWEKE